MLQKSSLFKLTVFCLGPLILKRSNAIPRPIFRIFQSILISAAQRLWSVYFILLKLLLMITGSFPYLKGPVYLLKKHYTGKMVRESHGGKAEAAVALRFQPGIQPIT